MEPTKVVRDLLRRQDFELNELERTDVFVQLVHVTEAYKQRVFDKNVEAAWYAALAGIDVLLLPNGEWVGTYNRSAASLSTAIVTHPRQQKLEAVTAALKWVVDSASVDPEENPSKWINHPTADGYALCIYIKTGQPQLC